jgi:O-antigen/teichoic acid export membrane protein
MKKVVGRFNKQDFKRNRKIVENFSYLSILQVFNLVLPLITYPYLIRILGKETYGGVVFAQAIVGYFAILVGYGFNISATKSISIHKNNKDKVSEIVSSVLIIKIFLFILSFLFLYFLLQFSGSFGLNTKLFYLTMYLCLNELLFPVWYFQGIEKMKFTTIFNLVSRLIFLGLIFIFIKNQNDYLLVPLINGIGVTLAGVFSLYIIFFVHKVRFQWQKKTTLWFYFVDSSSLFLSNAMVLIKERSNIVFIGSFLSMSEVSYYDLILKIASILRTPFMTIRDAIFPNIAESQNQSKYGKVAIISIILSVFVYLFLIFFKQPIVVFIGGEEMLPALELIPLMGLIIPLGVTSMFAGSALILFYSAKRYTLSIIYSLIAFILGLYILYIFDLFSLNYLVILLIITLLVEIVSRLYLYYKK